MVRMTIYSLVMLAAGSSVDLFNQSDRRRLEGSAEESTDHRIVQILSDKFMPIYNMIEKHVTGKKVQQFFDEPLKHFQTHKDNHSHLYCLLFPKAETDVLVKALTDSDLAESDPIRKENVIFNKITKYILYANVVTYGASFLTIPGFNWLLRLVFGKWFILFFASNLVAIRYWLSYPQLDENLKSHQSLKYPTFVVSFVVVQIADTVTYIFGFGPLKWIHNILSVFFQLYYFLNFMFITAIPVYASLHQGAPLVNYLTEKFKDILPKDE